MKASHKIWVRYAPNGDATPTTRSKVAQAYARECYYPLEFALKEVERIEQDFFPDITLHNRREGRITFKYEVWGDDL